MSVRVLIEPAELREAARGYRDAALAQSELGCSLGGAVPDMPADLRGRVEAAVERAQRDIGEQQEYMRDEADWLVRRAELARRAGAGGWGFGLPIGDLLGFGGVPALDERYTPPPPPDDDDDGGGLLDTLGEISGVNDARRAIDSFADGDVLGGLGSLAMAVPNPAGKLAKGGKLLKEGVEGAAKKGDDVADAARKADPPPRVPRVEKADSPVWQGTKPFRGKTRTNGESGRRREYYEWDNTHGDIEVYDRTGRHLGTRDPLSGELVKPPVPGRRIDI